MLSAIFSQVGMTIINSILGQALEAFKAYENKQISVEQLRDQLYGLMINASRDVEVSHADALAKTYSTFMAAASQSRLMQIIWAAVTVSQLMVLLWVQVGVSALCYFVGNHACWPSSGDTANWAYLLVGACVGMGPMVLRSGPGAGNFIDKWKSLVGK